MKDAPLFSWVALGAFLPTKCRGWDRRRCSQQKNNVRVKKTAVTPEKVKPPVIAGSGSSVMPPNTSEGEQRPHHGRSSVLGVLSSLRSFVASCWHCQQLHGMCPAVYRHPLDPLAHRFASDEQRLRVSRVALMGVASTGWRGGSGTFFEGCGL